MNKFRISVWEFLLIQIVFYAIIWLIDEYIGSLLTVVLTPIFFMILVVALIAEVIDRSRVPRAFFYYFSTCIIAPAVVGIFFAVVYEGKFDWLQN
jgi:hypothetical protein